MIAELLVNALISGLLLGGFYAAISIGLSISFGLLDTVNIAHPTFLVLGAFLGVLIAFLKEHLDNTLKTTEDVEKKLGFGAG